MSAGPRLSGGWFVALFLVAVAASLHYLGGVTFLKTELLSGPLLFLLILILAGYGARRRLPRVLQMSASGWMRLHVLLGSVAALLFLVHVRLRIPNGTLESTLAAIYLIVTTSGVVGVWINRRAMRRLARGEEALAESVPSARRKLAERLDELIVSAVRETGSTALATFQERRLVDFFSGTRNVLSHLLDSRRPRQRLLAELAGAIRELGERERDLGGEIAGLIRMKDDLDELDAIQLVLRGWLLVHVPLTYLLIVLAVIHGLLARAYFGGQG